MLDLLQETLLYIEEQNEWLNNIQMIITEKGNKYKQLHAKISRKIIVEIEKNNEQQIANVKEERVDESYEENNVDYNAGTDVAACSSLSEHPIKQLAVADDEAFPVDQSQNNVNEDYYVYMPQEESNYGEFNSTTEAEQNHNLAVEKNQQNFQSGTFDSLTLGYFDQGIANGPSGSNDLFNDGIGGLSFNAFHKPQHTCSYCNKQFHIKSKYNDHLRRHTGVKPFKCEYCQKTFSFKCNLKTHIRVHTGERPFVCKICSKTFNQKGPLITHMRMHSGEKPFVCRYCNRGFTTKVYLKAHIRIHTNEKPFKCMICGLAFRMNQSLKKHTESVHCSVSG